MFYFLFPSQMTYDFILVIAAVVPAVFLMLKAYRSDRLEKESPAILWDLVKAGLLSSLMALVAERVLVFILNLFVSDDRLYNILLYFGVVACAEEGAKYFMLTRHSWRSPEFDCQYDGIVYAVFVSLGFALWENVSYVMQYGFGTAILRALTAIPGHACFGVFMGVFYGIAKKYDARGVPETTKTFRVLAFVVPALLHGAYDYIASMERGTWFFVVFIAALFAISYMLVSRMSKNDQYIE